MIYWCVNEKKSVKLLKLVKPNNSKLKVSGYSKELKMGWISQQVSGTHPVCVRCFVAVLQEDTFICNKLLFKLQKQERWNNRRTDCSADNLRQTLFGWSKKKKCPSINSLMHDSCRPLHFLNLCYLDVLQPSTILE